MYRVYSMTVLPQDVCGACHAARERAMKAPDTEEQKRKRREAFGGGQ
jgi:hypothetical protein